MASHPSSLATALEERLRALETDFHTAWWESQVNASPESDRRRADLELELRRAKGDSTAYAQVKEALRSDIHESLLKRQLQLLFNSMTSNQMDEQQRSALVEVGTSVESDFARFRPEIDGRRLSENDIEEILRTSDDPDERRKAWEASKEIGEILADRIRGLARMRNETARDLGFADYYRMSLELQEISESWLFETLDEMEGMTAEPFARWKSELDHKLRDRFGVDVLYPWHYADPFFQSLPPDGAVSLDPLLGDASAADLALATFQGWDIELDGVMAASDLHPRENKNQHAFCLDVDRTGRDVRVLANIVPGERWVEIILHESGHAAYDVKISNALPYLLHRPAHTFVTEAIAILCGKLARDPRWLRDVARIDASQVSAIQGKLAESTAAQSLLFSRWGLVMVHFERDLYSDPEADLDSRWWDHVRRFQSIEPPAGRSKADWAAKIHLGAAPVYYQNYLLGEMLAAQIQTTCEKECGGLIDNVDAGHLLTERIFEPGASLPWPELVESATGRSLGAEDFSNALLL